jgi:hypothetical protein
MAFIAPHLRWFHPPDAASPCELPNNKKNHASFGVAKLV